MLPSGPWYERSKLRGRSAAPAQLDHAKEKEEKERRSISETSLGTKFTCLEFQPDFWDMPELCQIPKFTHLEFQPDHLLGHA